MEHIDLLSRADIDRLIAKRPGEVKLGERVRVAESENWLQEVESTDAKFVLIGIPEDIGVRANHGVGGSHTFWKYALGAILNVQDTGFLNGEALFVLGSLDISQQMNESENVSIDKLRALVSEVDDIVYPVIQKIVAAGKVPIIIGGGHNNAYPILKGASEALNTPLNCINLDPHSDYRGMEGRHSGNGFRYAKREGYLETYYALGLHENYNGQNIIDEEDDDPNLFFTFFEDIFLREKKTFYDAVRHAMNKTQGNPVGLELDMDCLERSLASAATPSGITAIQARRFVSWVGHTIHPTYFHIAEGAYELRDGRRDSLTPKMAAYLVTDFMKAYLEKRRSKLL